MGLMRSRRHRIYVAKSHSSLSFQFGRSKRLSAVLQTLKFPEQIQRSSSTPALHSSSPPCKDSTVVRDIYTIRTRLRGLSCLLTSLHALLCMLCYVVGVQYQAYSRSYGAGLCIGLSVFSTAEVMLIVVYWQLCWRLSELQHAALRLDHVRAPSIWQAPDFLWPCVLEAAGHVLVPYPGLDLGVSLELGGVHTFYTLNDGLFVCLILRNYHLLRVLYWYSSFSHLRTLMYTRITTVTMGKGFVFRCYMKRYGLSLVLGIYGLVVGLAGPVQYVFEKTSSTQVDTGIWMSFFAAAYTQSTIGYGVGCSTTLFAQLAITFSVFSGIFLQGLVTTAILDKSKLKLQEFHMCVELMNGRDKRKHMDVIARVIQSWWRLLKSRLRRQTNVAIVSLFYSELAKFRRVLVHCYHINQGLFINQVACFHTKVQTNIRSMNNYLYVVRHASELVSATQTQDLIRNEYRISYMADKVKQLANRQKGRGSVVSEEIESPISHKSRFATASSKTVCSIAKAEHTAVQNAKMRMIKQKDPDFLDF